MNLFWVSPFFRSSCPTAGYFKVFKQGYLLWSDFWQKESSVTSSSKRSYRPAWKNWYASFAVRALSTTKLFFSSVYFRPSIRLKSSSTYNIFFHSFFIRHSWGLRHIKNKIIISKASRTSRTYRSTGQAQAAALPPEPHISADGATDRFQSSSPG